MKNKIIAEISKTIKSNNFPKVEISIEKPKNKANGDIASNVAFLLSKKLNKNPFDIANQLKNELAKSPLFKSVKIAKPGFINFRLNTVSIINYLENIIIAGNNYGKNNSGKKKKVLTEFVSANPTGPLTVGHGRGAIIGDTISSILQWNGYAVHREYYYNNAGKQMKLLGESLKGRYYELLDKSYDFPEEGYKGEYIKDIARKLADKHDKKFLINKDEIFFKSQAENEIFKQIKKTLSKINLNFDSYFNEYTLYENKDIYEVVDKLKAKNLIYNKDEAVWFKATDVGLASDRVLIKSTGEPTYRLPDIAYHITKFERGYDLCIDIFGADHMDTYPDVLAALSELGYNNKNITFFDNITRSVKKFFNGKIILSNIPVLHNNFLDSELIDNLNFNIKKISKSNNCIIWDINRFDVVFF